MSLQGDKTQAAFKQGKKVIPHGVNSNFRYWGDDDTLVIKRGEGTYVWDMDGKRYIDYRLGFGPVILGHSYPQVVERVQEALRGGNIFAWTTPYEISVAERITSSWVSPRRINDRFSSRSSMRTASPVRITVLSEPL